MAELLERLRSVLAGRYALERELGRGGMATVYLAQDLKHRRSVAVKVLRPEIAQVLGPERFLREIGIAATLAHPHILPLYDSGEADGLLYYVMPYVAGESLRARLDRETQLPLDDALVIVRQVAGALGYAHSLGIVHRDIKPENILLEEGEAVVADFGIARALSAAASDRLSEPGLAIGTPAYMSPEQSTGGELDGRSDIYSLGCVLYEMLAGEPPFTGPTGEVVLARQRSERPRSLRVVRPAVPASIERVLETALAKLPADRFRTAAGLSDALAAVTGTGGAHAAPASPRPARRRWRLFGAGVLLLGALGAFAVVGAPRREPAPKLDAELYAVLPFAHRDGLAAELLDGDQCESLMHETLSRWSGVRLVDPLWLSDARARRGGGAVSLEDALAIARERGAGRLVTGEVHHSRGAIQVRAAVYDVARDGATLQEGRVVVRPDLADATARFDALAQVLLTGYDERSASYGAAVSTRSISAWRAFEEGTRALERFDLPTAKDRFRTAVRRDPAYPQPHFWLAQALVLDGEPVGAWREHAAAAVAHGNNLPAAERTRARALLAMADSRYPEACERYRSLIRADSLDFLAWFGLGECHRNDRIVEPDAGSPSGWRFRAGLQTAVGAYRRALDIVPSSHLLFRGSSYQRLADLFFTDENAYRIGYRIDPDTTWFGAWPVLGDGDTLSLVPYPLEQFLGPDHPPDPAAEQRALSRARQTLRELGATWTGLLPLSPDAHEAYARALEVIGSMDDAPGAPTALAEVQEARRLAADSLQRVRLAGSQVRLLLKLERFAEARSLADSTLESADAAGPLQAEQLVGLAALTGRLARTVALLRVASRGAEAIAPDGTPVRPPPAVADAVAILLAYAALGAPADSVRRAYAQAERLIASYFRRDELAHARAALLGRPERLAFIDAGLRPAERPIQGGEYLRQLQWDLASGDTAGVHDRLLALGAQRTGHPGSVSIEGTFNESRLILATRDTATAIAWLEPSLAALPTLGADLLLDVADAASLVRVMTLRAELAVAVGDSAAARRWATAVVALRDGVEAPMVSDGKRARRILGDE